MYQSRHDSEQIIKILVDRYPECFFEEPKLRRPLKKDIVTDLLNDNFQVGQERLAAAIEWYKSHFAYHYALQPGAERIGLNGKAVEKVTELEARKAQEYIADRQADRTRNFQVTNSSEVVVRRELPVYKPPPGTPDHPMVMRLQAKIDAIRRVMTETDPTSRTAFAVAGLGILAREAKEMIDELQSG